MQPIEMVRQVLEEVYGNGKLELLPQLLGDGFATHDPIRGRLDRAGVESNVQMYRRAFPDLKVEVIDSLSSGDKGMVRWRASGTHKGELMGIQPTNKRVTIEGISEVRASNGKIIEGWDQWDALGMMRQIGALPEQLAGARPDGGGRTQPQQPSRR